MTETDAAVDQQNASQLPGLSLFMHSPLPGFDAWFAVWSCDVCAGLMGESGRVMWNGKPAPQDTPLCSRAVSTCSDACAVRLAEVFPTVAWLSLPVVDFLASLASGHGFGQAVLDRIGRASMERLLRDVVLEPSTSESGGPPAS